MLIYRLNPVKVKCIHRRLNEAHSFLRSDCVTTSFVLQYGDSSHDLYKRMASQLKNADLLCIVRYTFAIAEFGQLFVA